MEANTSHKYIDKVSFFEDKKLSIKSLKNQSKKSFFTNRKTGLRKFNAKYRSILISFLFITLILACAFALDKVGITEISDFIVVERSGGEFSYIDSELLEYYLESKFNGISYYKLDEEKVKNSITSYTPYVKDITISKLFPSSVKILIIEKKPILTVRSGSRCGVIDDAGLCLNKISEDFTCEDLAKLTSTKILQADSLQLSFAINKPISFYDTDLILMTTQMIEQSGYSIESYTYTDETYSFNIESGQQIIFTSLESFELQQKRMLISLSEIDSRKMDFKILDVRYDRPVITTK